VPIAHDACTDCHTDPHLADLGTTCTGCHGAADWRVSRFDHDLARFHLEGVHTDLACAACHGASKVRPIRHGTRERPMRTIASCRLFVVLDAP
jgi:hypothetical protein